jgi:arginine exporter protein ArgO
MPAFFEGVIAGYGIAIPVGAIAVLIIERALRAGFAQGFAAGAGAAGADFIYAGLAALAGERLAALLLPYSTPLRIASALVLLAIGGYGLWRLRNGDGAHARQVVAHGRAAQTFFQFLGLTLLNPMTIAYFAALILGREAGSVVGTGERLLFVAGAGLASLSWQTLLAVFGSLAHRRMPPQAQRLTGMLGNLIVISLGLNILLSALG